MSLTDDQLVAAMPRRDPEPGDVGVLDEPSEVLPEAFLIELGAEIRRVEKKAAILEEQGRNGRAAKLRKKAAKARRKLVRSALAGGNWRIDREALASRERTQVALTFAPLEAPLELPADEWPTPENPMIEFPPEPLEPERVESEAIREIEGDTLVLSGVEVEDLRQVAAGLEVDAEPVAEAKVEAEGEPEPVTEAPKPIVESVVVEPPVFVSEVPVGASALVARIGAYTALPERVAV